MEIARITVAMFDADENILTADQCYINKDGEKTKWQETLTKVYNDSIVKFYNNLTQEDALMLLSDGVIVALFEDKLPLGQVRLTFDIREEEPTVDYPFDV